MQQLLLGIDIGTSACKVALFSPDGMVIGQQSADYPVYYPAPGWAEQDPQQWWEAVCAAIRALLEEESINPSEIAGVGVDGQSWSAIPLDRNGRVLHNTPIWMDTRSAGICDDLRERFCGKVFETCGNPLQASYSFPKILWYQQNCPEMMAKADKILQSNSFIAYRLTGEISQDLSQGYGLCCFDMRRGRWDRDFCRELGVDPTLLPEIAPCHQVVGTVTPEAARQTGLAAGTPVVAGGLDAACGTLGAGVVHPGETQEQGGQAGGMSICIDRYNADPRLILSYHVVPDLWLLQGGTVGGGGVIRWFEEQFGAAEALTARQSGTRTMAEMDVLAGTVPPGSEGLVFLPYMAGERSPIWDSKAKGVYYGVDFSKTRAHFIRASMEGVAYSLLHNLETAQEAGAVPEILRAMGGAANSRLWTQIKADVTGKTIVVPASDTATTLGAAILAGVGTGVYGSFEQAVSQTVTVKREHHPNPEAREAYQKGYQTYRKLYEDLRETMQQEELQ